MVTPEEMRLLVGLDPDDGDKDALLARLLADAESYVRTFCHIPPETEVPDWLISRMAAEDYGRMEGAGVTSRTASGAAEYFRGTYSPDLRAAMSGMRRPAAPAKGATVC